MAPKKPKEPWLAVLRESEMRREGTWPKDFNFSNLSWAHSGTVLANKPVHPTLRSRQKLARGRIQRFPAHVTVPNPSGGPPILKPKGRGKVVFNFLFQPPRVGMAWQMDPSAASSDLLATNSSGYDPGMLGGNAAVDFTLLLDRTPDIIEGTVPEGVQHDMTVLSYLLGPDMSSAETSGYIAGHPLDVWIGGPKSMRWWAIVTSMSVEFTHFTRDMVPIRAGISLQMQRYHDIAIPSIPPNAPTGEMVNNLPRVRGGDYAGKVYLP